MVFGKLLQSLNPSLKKTDGTPKTSGELVTEVMNGDNLVNGKQTWELAQSKKHDIEVMKQCCDSELSVMKKAGIVAAPHYFERVAILSRKLKDYEQEVYYCELYIKEIKNFYASIDTKRYADVRKGATYKAIVKRLPKAKDLLDKSKI